jgi:hypothetical protein
MITKKNILILLTSALVLSVLLLVFNFYDDDPLDSIDQKEQIWLKCTNKNCNADFQIKKRDYFEYIEENKSGSSLLVPLYPCEICGEKTCRRAIKCPKCHKVFIYGISQSRYPDHCPYCGFSKMEKSK